MTPRHWHATCMLAGDGRTPLGTGYPIKMTNEILLRVYPDLLFPYHRHSLLITGRDGTIDGDLQGLYEHDVRLLSRYRLLLNGRPPRLDSYSAVDPYSTLAYYTAPPTPASAARLDDTAALEFEMD